MKKQLMVVLAIMSLTIALVSCSDDKNPVDNGGNGGNGDEDPTFAADVLPILTSNCAVSGCHVTGTAAFDLVMTATLAYGNLVNVASGEVPSLLRVNPGVADSSYIVHKISGTQAVGGRMPLGRNPLSSGQIQTIRDWIDAGALNN